MISAIQSMERNNAGGLTFGVGVGAGSALAGAALVFVGTARVVLAGAPEDGCFLSFGTFGFLKFG